MSQHFTARLLLIAIASLATLGMLAGCSHSQEESGQTASDSKTVNSAPANGTREGGSKMKVQQRPARSTSE